MFTREELLMLQSYRNCWESEGGPAGDLFGALRDLPDAALQELMASTNRKLDEALSE